MKSPLAVILTLGIGGIFGYEVGYTNARANFIKVLTEAINNKKEEKTEEEP